MKDTMKAAVVRELDQSPRYETFTLPESGNGVVVDVLAAPATDADPGKQASSRVVATDAVVVLVSPKQKVQANDTDRVMLVALPARVANTVAGSVLGQEVTLTLH